VGVDNAFGYLGSATGRGEQLAESRRFQSERGHSTGVAVSLQTGAVILAPADGSHTWRTVDPNRACELAGIPAPGVDGEAETARRLDPFHVEHHASAVFVALVGLIHDRALPCAHALRAWRKGVWDGAFHGAYLEQAETFAASVQERITRTGADVEDAVVDELGSSLALELRGAEAMAVVADSRWGDALPELPGRIVKAREELDESRRSRRELAAADESQLALI
jgi:hypothetical protein